MITTIYLVRTPSGVIRLLRAESDEQMRQYLRPLDAGHVWRKATEDDLYMFRGTPIEDATGARV